MKKKFIWLSIPFSVLASIAKGADVNNLEAQSNMQELQQTEVTAYKNISLEGDGSVLLITEEGKLVRLDAKIVKILKRLQLNKTASFKDSNPCVGTISTDQGSID